MKYLVGVICAIILLMAFSGQKCEHVYTAIEQPDVKIEPSAAWVTAIYTAPPIGKHEGPELICVKCFHKTKQVLDYGSGERLTGAVHGTDMINPLFLFDTVTTAGSGRVFVLKADSLIWSK
jgi:hypothetical protein